MILDAIFTPRDSILRNLKHLCISQHFAFHLDLNSHLVQLCWNFSAEIHF